MSQNPIFPPTERNFSPQELQDATAILDIETREMLAMDRARLLQSSAANIIALSRLIGLSEEVSRELNEAMLLSAKDLSPSYHAFLNSLLSAVTEVYAESKVIESPTLKEIEIAVGDMDQIQVDDVPEFAGPPLRIPEEEKLFQHDERSAKPIRRFLNDVISEDLFDVNRLKLDEASLLTWQILDFYRRMPVPRATPERKATHIERISGQVGLYKPPMTIREIAGTDGEAGTASIGVMLRTVKANLSPLIEPNVINMIARARKTLASQPRDSLFIPPQGILEFGETGETDEPQHEPYAGHDDDEDLEQELLMEPDDASQRSTIHG